MRAQIMFLGTFKFDNRYNNNLLYYLNDLNPTTQNWNC